MKYSDYKQRENGFSLKGHSKFLQFILNFYCGGIARKFKKIHKLPKHTKLNASAEINFYLSLEDRQ